MEWDIVQFLVWPMVASLVLAGIHSYLGLHVVERGVIFVDLSLAQIASLGATLALLIPAFGGDPHGTPVYWMSLGFTFIGAAIFSLVKGHKSRIPQEAIIGITYAVAAAAVIVVMSKSTGETEHLRDMLVQHPVGIASRGHQDGRPVLAGGDLPLRVPAAVPADFDGSEGCRSAGRFGEGL